MKHFLTHSGCAQFTACHRVSTFFNLDVTEDMNLVTCEDCLCVLKTWASYNKESPKTIVQQA